MCENFVFTSKNVGKKSMTSLCHNLPVLDLRHQKIDNEKIKLERHGHD